VWIRGFLPLPQRAGQSAAALYRDRSAGGDGGGGPQAHRVPDPEARHPAPEPTESRLVRRQRFDEPAGSHRDGDLHPSLLRARTQRLRLQPVGGEGAGRGLQLLATPGSAGAAAPAGGESGDCRGVSGRGFYGGAEGVGG